MYQGEQCTIKGTVLPAGWYNSTGLQTVYVVAEDGIHYYPYGHREIRLLRSSVQKNVIIRGTVIGRGPLRTIKVSDWETA